MPSPLTHYEFLKESDKNATDIAFVGAQGPDPFFYYGHSVRFTKYAKSIRQYGSYLHGVDPYITFKFLLEYVIGANDEDKKTLFAFVKGLLAHYLLDKTCHPYIWYKSGFVTKNDNNKVKYFNSHTRIESAIDVLIMEHFHDSTNTVQSIKCSNKDLKLVSKMMFSLAKICYKNEDVSLNTYYKCIKQMRFTQRVLASKNGKKKAFIDKFFYNTPLSSMCLDQSKNLKLDFLNLNKKVWRDCVTNENPRKTTFYELFTSAQKEYVADIKVFENVVNGKTKITEIDSLFNEINHDGFKLNSIKVYSDYIFK